MTDQDVIDNLSAIVQRAIVAAVRVSLYSCMTEIHSRMERARESGQHETRRAYMIAGAIVGEKIAELEKAMKPAGQ